MAKNFISFWRNTQKQPGTEILAPDYPILNDNDLLISGNAFLAACKKYGFENVAKDKVYARLLHSDLPAEPFVGDLSNARVYMVSLNPGCGKDEYSATNGWAWQTLVNIAENNRKQQFSNNICKFYYMDPVLQNTGGGIYWMKYVKGRKYIHYHKLKQMVEKIAETKNISFDDARRYVSDRICDIELCPYHSCKWGIPTKILRQLPSTQQCLEFIKNTVVPSVLTGDKSLILLRHVTDICKIIDDSGYTFAYKNREYKFSELDTLGLPNVCFYRTNSDARRAPIRPNTPAGKVCFNAIK